MDEDKIAEEYHVVIRLFLNTGGAQWSISSVINVPFKAEGVFVSNIGTIAFGPGGNQVWYMETTLPIEQESQALFALVTSASYPFYDNYSNYFQLRDPCVSGAYTFRAVRIDGTPQPLALNITFRLRFVTFKH